MGLLGEDPNFLIKKMLTWVCSVGSYLERSLGDPNSDDSDMGLQK
jgi:hypothetical protein